MLHTQEHAIAGKGSGVRSLVSRPPTDTRKGDHSRMYVRYGPPPVWGPGGSDGRFRFAPLGLTTKLDCLHV